MNGEKGKKRGREWTKIDALLISGFSLPLSSSRSRNALIGWANVTYFARPIKVEDVLESFSDWSSAPITLLEAVESVNGIDTNTSDAEGF